MTPDTVPDPLVPVALDASSAPRARPGCRRRTGSSSPRTTGPGSTSTTGAGRRGRPSGSCWCRGCCSRPGRGRPSRGGWPGSGGRSSRTCVGTGLSDAPDGRVRPRHAGGGRAVAARGVRGVPRRGRGARRPRVRGDRGGGPRGRAARAALRRRGARGRRLGAPRGRSPGSTWTSSCAAWTSRPRCCGRWTPISGIAAASTRPRGTRTRSGRRGTRWSRRRPGTWSGPSARSWWRQPSGRCSPMTRRSSWRRSRRRCIALVALGAGEPAAAEARLAELRRTAVARVAAGGAPCGWRASAGVAHNLMRYRAAEVTAAILAPAG